MSSLCRQQGCTELCWHKSLVYWRSSNISQVNENKACPIILNQHSMMFIMHGNTCIKQLSCRCSVFLCSSVFIMFHRLWGGSIPTDEKCSAELLIFAIIITASYSRRGRLHKPSTCSGSRQLSQHFSRLYVQFSREFTLGDLMTTYMRYQMLCLL